MTSVNEKNIINEKSTLGSGNGSVPGKELFITLANVETVLYRYMASLYYNLAW